ncbi:tagatose kinase [Manganibacter manganicus]|uniref:Sugar kinase n=1 Tax=Manganibacter manganicus TaxID=1873176 RepID=A0A1V8RQJ1_9HYPH|nr:sugar kinase [Pseudaminobacter manganicus]OQM75435.1 sugar kinase [Pseudaminobacter manganicus]
MSARSSSQALAPDSLGPTVTVGEILVEIMARTRGEGFLEPIDLTGPYPSGAPAIFIDQCARIGGSAGIVACVGNDDFGRINVERLRRDGADVSAIAVSPDYPTGSAFVRYRGDGSRDFVYNIAKSASGLVSLTREAKTLIGRAGHLHVMGTALSIAEIWTILEYAVEVIRGRGGSISVDPNMRKELLGEGAVGERFARMLDISDLVLPSGEELFTATGTTTEQDALASLFSRGAGEVVVKRGAQGASFFSAAGERADVAAFAVEEVDPTGAGDCFGGAYIACRRLGMPPQTVLDYANAAGARNVTRLGPMEGAGTRAELDRFMADTPRRPA